MKPASIFSLLFCLLPILSYSQSPIDISYAPSTEVDVTQLSPTALAAAPKECIIDFHYSAPSVRVVMESLDGTVNYVNRVYPLEVNAFPDSTYVYGKPGAWTIGLGRFTEVDEFRVKLLNPSAPGLSASVAQGTYP